MKIKLYKNTFLKFIFVNLFLVNITLTNNNTVEDNELFTCPQVQDNYQNLLFHRKCKRLQQLFRMLNDKKIYEEPNNPSLDGYSELNKYSNLSGRIKSNIEDFDFSNFLEYIRKYGNKETQQFFMVENNTSEENTTN